MEKMMVSVSVLMPVYNTPAGFLAEAVESILNQTFGEFEFLIVDDCSTLKETTEYLNSLDDPRVKIIRNHENLGITKSLNIGIREAAGKYIARMDSDDISLPQRLEKQYAFMEAHPEVVVCGSRAQRFGTLSSIWHVATGDQELYRIRLLFRNAGPAHPSVMYRREDLLKYHLFYDERLRYAQDYMMWVNALRVGVVHCMDDILIRYRFHEGQVSTAKAAEQRRCDNFVQAEQLSCLLDHVDLQTADRHKSYVDDDILTEESYRWFKKLIEANNKKGVYDKGKFRTHVESLIEDKLYPTYGINWKNLYSFRILFKYLPASYVFYKAKKIVAHKLGQIRYSCAR